MEFDARLDRHCRGMSVEGDEIAFAILFRIVENATVSSAQREEDEVFKAKRVIVDGSCGDGLEHSRVNAVDFAWVDELRSHRIRILRHKEEQVGIFQPVAPLDHGGGI